MIISEQRWHAIKVKAIADDLLPECAARFKPLLVEAAQDATVGEILDAIERIERTADSREELAQQLSNFEARNDKVYQMVKKTINSYRNKSGKEEAVNRLEKLMRELAEAGQEINDIQKKLLDPDVGIEDYVAIKEDVSKVIKTYRNVVMENFRALARDMQLANWNKVFDWSDDLFKKLSNVPFMASLTGLTKDISSALKLGAKAFSWISRQVASGSKAPAALGKLTDKVAQRDDIKTRTAPFMSLLNIDPEFQAMLDDDLEVEFIKYYKDMLKSKARDMKISELDIDSHLEKWIPRQSAYLGHTVAEQ